MTSLDFDALIPVIVELVMNNQHDIGDPIEPESNSVTYDRDGWYVEVEYDCYGEWDNDHLTHELRRGWGKVREIEATFGDDYTEEKRFSFEECRNMRLAVNKALRDM